MTLPSSRVHSRHSVQALFKTFCEPCQDGSEFIEATVFCENCQCYMCYECGKADEKLHRGKNKHTFVPISMKMKTDDLLKQEKGDDATKHKDDDEYSALRPGENVEEDNDSLEFEHAMKQLCLEDAKNRVTSAGQLPAAESICLKDAFEIDSDLNFERKRHIHEDVEQAPVNIPDLADTKDENGFGISDGELSEPESVDEEEGHNSRQDSMVDNEEVENVSGDTSEEYGEGDNDNIITESEEIDFVTLRQTVDIRYHEYETECDISDIACLSNGDIVLADKKKRTFESH